MNSLQTEGFDILPKTIFIIDIKKIFNLYFILRNEEYKWSKFMNI